MNYLRTSSGTYIRWQQYYKKVLKGGYTKSQFPAFGPNPIRGGCLQTDGMRIMNEKLHWLTLSGYKFIHLERKKSLILLDRRTIFLSNPCWHNHIKSTSLILTFTIFIRPAHISPLHFAAASAVVVTVQSKSVKDYSLQFSVQITALFAELKHFDDHNCAKCGKHFPNRTPFWSFSNGHVISPTTNHWTGKLTEFHSCIATDVTDVSWIGFLHFQKMAYLCKSLWNNRVKVL